jgi:hypothetical protein
MNLVDCTITKIIKPAHRRIDAEYCCFAVHVEYNCWGHISQKWFYATTLTEIEQYKVGYAWQQ